MPTIGQLRARSASDKAARRDQILAAAAAIAAGTPFDELAMADVAARAGLAKGTVFQYFATKDDLAAALRDRHLARWHDDLERRLARAAAPLAPATAARLLTESLAGRADLLRLTPRTPAPNPVPAPTLAALDRAVPYADAARLIRVALAAAAGLRATLPDPTDLPAELNHALHMHLAGLRAAGLRGPRPLID